MRVRCIELLYMSHTVPYIYIYIYAVSEICVMLVAVAVAIATVVEQYTNYSLSEIMPRTELQPLSLRK